MGFFFFFLFWFAKFTGPIMRRIANIRRDKLDIKKLMELVVYRSSLLFLFSNYPNSRSGEKWTYKHSLNAMHQLY